MSSNEVNTEEKEYSATFEVTFLLISILLNSIFILIGVESIYIGIKTSEAITISVKDDIFISSYWISSNVVREPFKHKIGEYLPGYISSYTYNGGPGYIPNTTDWSPRAPSLLFLKDVFFTTECVIIRDNGYHTFKWECHPRYWGIGQPYYKPNYSCKIYESVICIGHQHTSDFGHWYLEILPLFFLLPSNLLNSSYIAVPFVRSFILSNLEPLNIGVEKFIHGDNEAYYAKKFYTVESSFCGDLNLFSIIYMRQFLVDRYDLDRKRPTRFVLANRESGMSRHISNFDKVFDTIQKRIPEIRFENVTYYNTTRDQSRYFNSIKLIFSIHCSLLSNVIVMQPKTLVVEIQMQNWLLSFIYLASFTNKYSIQGRDESILHHEEVDSELSPEYAACIVERGLVFANMIKRNYTIAPGYDERYHPSHFSYPPGENQDNK